jgi:microcystin degradation protein MlrC
MTFKILSAEFSHETNTFNVYPTTLDSFTNRLLLDGKQAIAQLGSKNTALAGLLDVGAEHNWQIEHCFSASAGPGGKVTSHAFDEILKPLVQRFSQQWDGVFLMLHGAMVTDFFDDGEGEILCRVRAALGPDIPIAVTLDPHANVTSKMCQLAQILVSYTTYPHVDMRETGQRAARILQRALLKEIQPQTLRAHRPMLEEVNGGRTDIGPMIERHRLAREYEQQADVHAVSINGAFASADICELGPTVLICCSGNTSIHLQQAENIAEDIWSRRDQVLNIYYSCNEVADIASKWQGLIEEGPLVIADYADNPGAGAYGDSTALLKALLESNIENACFGPLVDPQAISELQNYQLGAQVCINIGGKIEPKMGGGPLQVNAQIIWQGSGLVVGTGPMMAGLQKNFGECVVLKIQGIEVLMVSIAQQILDLNQFQTFGIDPREKTVVALKSMQHFRAAFEPIAGEIIVCDSGALCTVNYKALNYQKVPRPIYPLD